MITTYRTFCVLCTCCIHEIEKDEGQNSTLKVDWYAAIVFERNNDVTENAAMLSFLEFRAGQHPMGRQKGQFDPLP